MAKTDLPSQVKRSEALNRLLMLAALMLSLMGGLWVMSGSAPLAAQTGASATRSFSSDSVTPGATITVTIASADYGALGSVTETLPAGFAYVSQSGAFGVRQDGQQVTFTLLGANQTVSYDVTASSTDGTYSFSGTLRDDDTNDHTVGGSTDVTVSTDSGPAPTPGAIDIGDNQFDVVPSKAVKGAVVSGLGNPIDSNPLMWDVFVDETGLDSSATLVGIAGNGVVGDFQVKQVSAGKFGLYVMNSGAPNLDDTQPINVEVTYDPDASVEDDNVVVNLNGDITERPPLSFSGAPFAFTIPQDISSGTPVGGVWRFRRDYG